MRRADFRPQARRSRPRAAQVLSALGKECGGKQRRPAAARRTTRGHHDGGTRSWRDSRVRVATMAGTLPPSPRCESKRFSPLARIWASLIKAW